MSVELSLIMPCLNEAETLATCIHKAHQGAKEAGVIEYEVVVVDNGSKDGSQEIAIAEGARVVNAPIRGYGSALQAGIQAAKGKYVIMGDADDSYDWSAIAPFVERLRAGWEMVIGTRLKGDIKPGAMPFLHRWLGNPILTAIGNIMFGTRISDYHCGMRGFQRNAMLDLDLHTPGMEFATEMVVRAAMKKKSITEVPIIYYPDGRARKPHLRTWSDGWRHLSFMLVLSPNWVFLLPGFLLISAGLIGNLLLLPGPRSFGSIILDIHTLLVISVFMIIGSQIVGLWIVARMFAANNHILPAPGLIKYFSKADPLKSGVLLGVLLNVLGIILLAESVRQWSLVGFGGLEYKTTLRLVIPGLISSALGMQFFFTSFVLSLLNFSKYWGADKE